MLDVIIIGGGPAGMSAALVLARCRRSVLVFDDGHPRNRWARRSHNFLTRDGTPPAELHDLARAELGRYGVDVVSARVAQARCACPAALDGRNAPNPAAFRTAFEVTLNNGQTHRARKLLLATGVRDVLPELPGFLDHYGAGVHHCPYCDALEYSDQPLVAFGEGDAAVGLALALRTWSDRVTACTHGRAIDDEQRGRLSRNGVAHREEPVARLEGDDRLRLVVFAFGPPLPAAALFFNTGHVQKSNLPEMLGCDFDPEGHIVTQAKQHTCVSGLYLAGDADGDTQFIVVAAAEGATAATAINRDLQDEDRGEGKPIGDAWRFARPA